MKKLSPANWTQHLPPLCFCINERKRRRKYCGYYMGLYPREMTSSVSGDLHDGLYSSSVSAAAKEKVLFPLNSKRCLAVG